MVVWPSYHVHVSFYSPLSYNSSRVYHFQNSRGQHCNTLQLYACILLVLKDLSSEAETAQIPWRPDHFACQ